LNWTSERWQGGENCIEFRAMRQVMNAYADPSLIV